MVQSSQHFSGILVVWTNALCPRLNYEPKSRTVARYEVVGFGWHVSAETVVGSWLDIEESQEIFLSRDLPFNFIYFIQPFSFPFPHLSLLFLWPRLPPFFKCLLLSVLDRISKYETCFAVGFGLCIPFDEAGKCSPPFQPLLGTVLRLKSITE